MKKIAVLLLCCFSIPSFSQSVTERLNKTISQLQADSQFKHAIISLYVVDTQTGKLVFDKNADIGLAPASCQKIITGATAFELLGNNYRFKTVVGYHGAIAGDILNGDLIIKGGGDPTLGSWRWAETGDFSILKKITAAIAAKGIKKINGRIVCDQENWETNSIPGGWVWEDIGNYYGAGATGINWHENQYDLILKSGNTVGDAVIISGTMPSLQDVTLISELTTAKKGSGDNAYIYLAPQSGNGFVRGTIPAGEDHFTISGSIPDPAKQFSYELRNTLNENNIQVITVDLNTSKGVDMETILASQSPTLDSMNYWFLKKSINLYGEALLKTMAYEKTKFGSTDKGIDLVKDFWNHHGIETAAINIKDGSGLSPANRITTKSLVTVLQYAKQQNWFASFYNALPEINGIRMKDGYIADVRSYCGFIKDKNGNEYTFSFIVNNFDGSASSARVKMWQVLDTLK